MGAEFAMRGVQKDSPAAVCVTGYRGDVREWGRNWGIEVQDNWKDWGLIPGLMGKTRLVYPHIYGGRVRYLSARNILGAEINKEGREVKSFNLPKELAGDRQTYYNHEYAPRAEVCVVVEGQADAITLGQWGKPAAAMIGTAWTDQERVLSELRKRHQRLYLGMDADQAGQEALIGRDHDWPLASLLGPMTRVVMWGMTGVEEG